MSESDVDRQKLKNYDLISANSIKNMMQINTVQEKNDIRCSDRHEKRRYATNVMDLATNPVQRNEGYNGSQRVQTSKEAHDYIARDFMSRQHSRGNVQHSQSRYPEEEHMRKDFLHDHHSRKRRLSSRDYRTKKIRMRSPSPTYSSSMNQNSSPDIPIKNNRKRTPALSFATNKNRHPEYVELNDKGRDKYTRLSCLKQNEDDMRKNLLSDE